MSYVRLSAQSNGLFAPGWPNSCAGRTGNATVLYTRASQYTDCPIGSFAKFLRGADGERQFVEVVKAAVEHGLPLQGLRGWDHSHRRPQRRSGSDRVRRITVKNVFIATQLLFLSFHPLLTSLRSLQPVPVLSLPRPSAAFSI